ncbi:hypothetical protein PLICRDRAFT_111679 [Plicaturopsis crispa FD-325 SS-3]|nr:hypothetical protein PLICRDRAFT_111679 [Plicaturopsis crispa FD-325 SS-3]
MDESERERPKKKHRSTAARGDQESNAPSLEPKSKQRTRKKSKRRSRHTAKALESFDTKAVLKVAIRLYRSWLCAINPYPEDNSRDVAASQAWSEACHLKEFEGQEFNETLRLLIVRRGSQVRGELVTKARPIVKGYFGFHSGKDDYDVDHNRDLVELLKANSGYLYADPEERVGLCESRLVQEIVNAMWFVNRVDEGVTETTFFKPLQAVTIALVFTAIEHCIDEYSTGSQKDADFSELLCKPLQQAHLQILNDFEKYNSLNFASIMSDIYEMGL